MKMFNDINNQTDMRQRIGLIPGEIEVKLCYCLFCVIKKKRAPQYDQVQMNA